MPICDFAMPTNNATGAFHYNNYRRNGHTPNLFRDFDDRYMEAHHVESMEDALLGAHITRTGLQLRRFSHREIVSGNRNEQALRYNIDMYVIHIAANAQQFTSEEDYLANRSNADHQVNWQTYTQRGMYSTCNEFFLNVTQETMRVRRQRLGAQHRYYDVLDESGNPIIDIQPRPLAFSHFYISRNGGIYQFIDTQYESIATEVINNNSISVEHGGISRAGLSDAQIAASGFLLEWCNRIHHIPLELNSTERLGRPPVLRGIVYHSQFVNSHSANAHTDCPGPRAISQSPLILQIAQFISAHQLRYEQAEGYLANLTSMARNNTLENLVNTRATS